MAWFPRSRQIAIVAGVAALSAGAGSIATRESTPAGAASYGAPVASAAILATGNPNIFVELSEKVVPSVVNISTRSAVNPSLRPYDLFGPDFGPRQRSPRGRRSPGEGLKALGSGVIIESRGERSLILTNNHVIAGADSIEVQFSESLEQAPVAAKAIARDPDLDLALLEIKTEKKLKALAFGDSDEAKVGEFVLAVGNPFAQGHSVSHGIISAKGRDAPVTIGSYLQTDAPINPGNSGGPLVNLKGEIVGINNAILARAQGIGFAIPSNEIKRVIPQLREGGKVQRGYLGIQMGELTPETAAFVGHAKTGTPYVAQVEPGGPAAKAGIREHDIIVSLNEKEVDSARELLQAVTALGPGQEAKLKVLRSGKSVSLKVKLGERPSNSSS